MSLNLRESRTNRSEKKLKALGRTGTRSNVCIHFDDLVNKKKRSNFISDNLHYIENQDHVIAIENIQIRQISRSTLGLY